MIRKPRNQGEVSKITILAVRPDNLSFWYCLYIYIYIYIALAGLELTEIHLIRLPSAGIKVVHHHTWPSNLSLILRIHVMEEENRLSQTLL